jgi:hypothetical protein
LQVGASLKKQKEMGKQLSSQAEWSTGCFMVVRERAHGLKGGGRNGGGDDWCSWKGQKRWRWRINPVVCKIQTPLQKVKQQQ